MKATNSLLLFYLCFILGSSVIAAMTRDTSQSLQQHFGQAGNPDQHFINEAVQGGKMEVDIGNIAKEKAENPRVRQFANMMVRDHTRINDKLASILKEKSYATAPGTGKDKKTDHAASLKSQTGKDFDKAYMKMMVKDHDKIVDLYTKQTTHGKDSDLKSFATKTLPSLKMHLDSAKSIHSDLDKSTIY